MCRLFGFRATHPTRIDCGLIQSQNSLVRQSRQDARGLANPDGWGLGLVRDGEIRCEREVEPAYESAAFRRSAADAEATTAMAHVRRATVGEPALENTHPFRRDGSLLAHNGHLPGFPALRPRLLEAMAPDLRSVLGGETDTEHVIHLLLTRLRTDPSRPEETAKVEAGRGCGRCSGRPSVCWKAGAIEPRRAARVSSEVPTATASTGWP